MTVINKAHG